VTTPDPESWDRFVEASEPGSYLQLSGWATVKAANGWSAHRLVTDADVVRAAHAGVAGGMHADTGAQGPASPRIGAQILVRRPRPMPWAFAYAPRGPVAAIWNAETIEAFTHEARSRLPAAAGRVSHLRVDPEIELDGPFDPDGGLRHALRVAGWRPSNPIQPNATRLVDLRADEEALWGDLRKKWRQYVNKARSGGITVVESGSERLPDFYRIYRETADRAGFLIRTEAAYRDVWNAFGPAGRARLLFAHAPDGEPQATLLLVRCGPRVVEPYGGMTLAGGESRANYLLKWEAIRSSREAGATTYDLWGLATGGIAHFKTGFGGREVRYIGAWDLVLDPLGRRSYELAQRARVWWARRRHGIAGGGNAAAFGPAE
jgi:lipid II:glycine glycyltransferase (peptidoglycan interpeptide bridge formation enzyme)